MAKQSPACRAAHKAWDTRRLNAFKRSEAARKANRTKRQARKGA